MKNRAIFVCTFLAIALFILSPVATFAQENTYPALILEEDSTQDETNTQVTTDTQDETDTEEPLYEPEFPTKGRTEQDSITPYRSASSFKQGGLTYSIGDNSKTPTPLTVTAYDELNSAVVIPNQVIFSQNQIKQYGVVHYIMPDVFQDSQMLSSISLPAGVTSLTDRSFSGCSSLHSVSICTPMSIGKDTFLGCSSLRYMEFLEGGGIQSLGSSAFKGCSRLEEVLLLDGIETIGEWAFSGCAKLKTITFPSSIKEINPYAFNGCTELKTLSFPDKLIAIGDFAFASCTGLTDITIPPSVKKVGENAFSGCSQALVVHGERGSLAEAVAKAYGFSFKPTNAEPSPSPSPSPSATPTSPVNHNPVNPPDPNQAIDLSKDAVFTFEGDFSNIKEIRLDGHFFNMKYPTQTSVGLSGYPGFSNLAGRASSGSVVITLYRHFLDFLPDGQHTLEVVFDDNGAMSSGQLTFKLEHPPKPSAFEEDDDGSTKTSSNPKTGDESNTLYFALLLIPAALVLIYSVRKRFAAK